VFDEIHLIHAFSPQSARNCIASDGKARTTNKLKGAAQKRAPIMNPAAESPCARARRSESARWQGGWFGSESQQKQGKQRTFGEKKMLAITKKARSALRAF
jgi:hypothetical protein